MTGDGNSLLNMHLDSGLCKSTSIEFLLNVGIYRVSLTTSGIRVISNIEEKSLTIL